MTTKLDSSSSVIGSLFNSIETSSCAVAKNETQLVDIIFGYAIGTNSYNRTQLHKEYQTKAKGPLQTKALTIVDMNTPEKRTKVQLALKQWNATARAESQKSKEKAKSQYFQDLMSVIEMSKREINSKNSITAVVDNEGTIQAISITNPDMNPCAWHVDWLMSAPHNHIEGSSSRVSGAGSALIEDAFVKALKRQKLNPDTTLSADTLKKTAVTLEASFSKGFYTNLFFEEEGPKGGDDLILKGDHVFEFLEKYGGRAVFKD